MQKGESLFSVLERLDNEALIRNADVIKAYVRFVYPVVIKSGSYSLSAGMTLSREILDILVSGRQELLRVTIPGRPDLPSGG